MEVDNHGIDSTVAKLARRNSEDAMELIESGLSTETCSHDLSGFVLKRVLSHRETYGGCVTTLLGNFSWPK